MLYRLRVVLLFVILMESVTLTFDHLVSGVDFAIRLLSMRTFVILMEKRHPRIRPFG
jgi:hypothetical protein